jgi:DNA-binding CsgD family transcriptional regulator
LIAHAQNAEIYLAAAIANLHSDRLETEMARWLKSVVPHDNIIILAYFQDRNPEMLMSRSVHPDVHKNITSKYLTGAYLLDPFHDLHVNAVPRGVYRLSDVAPDQFQRNSYFTEYYQETTLLDEITFTSYPAKGVSIHTCLGRDPSSNSKFTTKEIQTAKRVSPIVSALVETRWKDLDTTGQYTEVATTVGLIEAAEKFLKISLSMRQAEVAMLILRGHSSVSIGLKLGISSQTVKVFRKQLYKKCNISSHAQLFNLLLPLLQSRS